MQKTKTAFKIIESGFFIFFQVLLFNSSQTSCVIEKTNDQKCQDAYGSDRIWFGDENDVDGFCDCRAGYVFNNSESYCVIEKSSTQLCQVIYGSNSIWSGSKNDQDDLICDCNSGYVFNSSQSYCIKEISIEETSEQENQGFFRSFWRGLIRGAFNFDN